MSLLNKVLISIFSLFTLTVSIVKNSDSGKHPIPKSFQRSGDPIKGFDYLVNGNYVSSGIPQEMLSLIGLSDTSNILGRTGEAGKVPFQFNLVDHDNGVKIVTPNCLTCHADSLNGELIIGLGNNSFDYRYNIQTATNLLAAVISNKYGKPSDEFTSFENFYKASKALSGKLNTEVRGLNPADKLTAVLIAHRNPSSLEWTDSLLLDIPSVTIPTDVPPWWILKKKNAMFYTAIGRGDFSKFLMASSILTLKDTIEANQIDQKFPDILAWINSLNPPKYPEKIDYQLADMGKKIFESNCSKCHGTYGNDSSYPNMMVSLDLIKTDSALSLAYTDSLYQNFIDWYNRSWFVQGEYPGQLVIESGYIAPPLDGIWASAPYLHNGSVPTISALLNSSERPKYWSRSFDSKDYNFLELGWNYTTWNNPENCNCYDTTLSGYGNGGHYFGDKLNSDERNAVIEYLKTL